MKKSKAIPRVGTYIRKVYVNFDGKRYYSYWRVSHRVYKDLVYLTRFGCKSPKSINQTAGLPPDITTAMWDFMFDRRVKQIKKNEIPKGSEYRYGGR